MSKVSAFRNRCDFHEWAPLLVSPQIWGEKQRGAIQRDDPPHFARFLNMSHLGYFIYSDSLTHASSLSRTGLVKSNHR